MNSLQGENLKTDKIKNVIFKMLKKVSTLELQWRVASNTYFCLRQHFHDDWKKNENNCSVEVESAKESKCFFKERKNLERDENHDTGQRSYCSLEKYLLMPQIFFI